MSTLTDKVALGEDELITIDIICKRLSVSRSTLGRWIRNTQENKSGLRFPAPYMTLGRSPRWKLATLVAWLEHNPTEP